jgi:hypothetical protein
LRSRLKKRKGEYFLIRDSRMPIELSARVGFVPFPNVLVIYSKNTIKLEEEIET